MAPESIGEPLVGRLLVHDALRQTWDALPVTADPVPVTAALTGGDADLPVVVHGVLTVVGAATLCEDLLGDDLLAERGRALTEEDERSVGEALAAQLDAADTVLTDAAPTTGVQTLLLHVCGPDVAVASLDEVLELRDRLDELDPPASVKQDHEQLASAATATERALGDIASSARAGDAAAAGAAATRLVRSGQDLDAARQKVANSAVFR